MSQSNTKIWRDIKYILLNNISLCEKKRTHNVSYSTTFWKRQNHRGNEKISNCQEFKEEAEGECGGNK